MRDAESLLDQVVSFTGMDVADAQITGILGIVDRDIVFEASGSVIQGDAEACVRLVERLYNHGYDIKEFYRALMEQFRNLLVSLIAKDAGLIDMTESDQEELRAQAREAGREKLQQVLNVLIRREEDLRFTSSPRLILETLLIKLCSMGEILGFGELMEKLDTLERRLAGDSTASYPPQKETPATSVGEPAAAEARAAEDVDSHREAGETPPQSGTGGGWDDFISFLGERNRVMANVLRQWRFEGLEGETLRIERCSNPFSATYLDDQDHMTRFTELAREFFGDKVRVLVTGDKKPEMKSAGGKPGPRAAGKAKAKADLPKPVQDVLHLFQGEVKEEIPATPGEGEEPGSQ